MSPAPMTREFKELPLGLLDRPQLDARIARDPEKLDELASDILRRGVIMPLAVVRTDARFEVVDGFRRYLAAVRAGLVVVPCFIYPTKDLALEGVKYAANAFREDMSPAEEAIFFHELLTHECAADIEQLCALVNKKLSYVDNRLALLAGDEVVFDALRHRQISIGVAQELNKCPAEDYRRYYLTFAIRDGATVSTVSGWIAEWRRTHENLPQPDAPALEGIAATAAAVYDVHRCYVCRKSDPRRIPQQVPIHPECLIAVLDDLLAAYRGELVPSE
jgi:ParB/RepB/Spo0J family partition protein